MRAPCQTVEDFLATSGKVRAELSMPRRDEESESYSGERRRGEWERSREIERRDDR